MADCKFINCTKTPAYYVDGNGQKVLLEKGSVAKLVVKKNPIGLVNGVLNATEAKVEVAGLPLPNGNLVYLVEEDVFLHLESKGHRVDVAMISSSAKDKGEESSKISGLSFGKWIKQKPYFSIGSEE